MAKLNNTDQNADLQRCLNSSESPRQPVEDLPPLVWGKEGACPIGECFALHPPEFFVGTLEPEVFLSESPNSFLESPEVLEVPKKENQGF